MSIFLTADWHFGHRNIIQHCNRPFDKAEAMDARIIRMYNEKVKAKNIVYHLGDVAPFKKFPEISRAMGQLNGTKRNVMGNHDRQLSKQPQWWVTTGFNAVYDFPILFDKFFILSHERVEWIDQDGAYANIHGHEHNRPDLPTVSARSFNAGVDCWGYPVTLNFAIACMKYYEHIEQHPSPEKVWSGQHYRSTRAKLARLLRADDEPVVHI